MSDVFIYDAALSPVNSTLIQIVENDSRGVKIDLQANGPRSGGLYGAAMKVPNPAVPIGIWVDDTSGFYAPTGLEFLNPSASLRLDVTLFPLPSAVPATGGGGGAGGGGGGGSSGPTGPGGPGSSDADDLTLRQHGWRFARRDNRGIDPRQYPMNDITELAEIWRWTDEETKGVTTLIATIARARTLVTPDDEFTARVRRWESRLRELEVIKVDIRDGHGGSSSGGFTFRTPLRPDLGQERGYAQP